jgi:hypothetical protein
MLKRKHITPAKSPCKKWLSGAHRLRTEDGQIAGGRGGWAAALRGKQKNAGAREAAAMHGQRKEPFLPPQSPAANSAPIRRDWLHQGHPACRGISLRGWSVFVNCVDRNSVGLPSIPQENAEWMGHRSLWQKQKRSGAFSVQGFAVEIRMHALPRLNQRAIQGWAHPSWCSHFHRERSRRKNNDAVPRGRPGGAPRVSPFAGRRSRWETDSIQPWRPAVKVKIPEKPSLRG